MTRSISSLAMLWLFFSLAFTGTALGQMPASWQDQLTDDTWIVGRFANVNEYLLWMPDRTMRGAFEAVAENPGPVICFATGSSFKAMIPDPDQKALRMLSDTAGHRPSVSLVNADGFTLIETRFSGTSDLAGNNPADEETRVAWVNLVGDPGDAALSVSIMARGDMGRVARELLPALITTPPEIDLQQLLADIDSIQVRFWSNSSRLAELSVRTTAPEAAVRVATAIQAIREWVGSMKSLKPEYAKQLFDMLLGGEVTVAEELVTVTRKNVAGQPGLNEILGQLREQQQSVDALNNVRHLILGMHNFESAYKELPGPAYGKGDSPGLSWRVAVLPFVGEQELYEQFRLDESWDSEHNRKLIPQMPPVFLHPSSTLQVSGGRSSFIVPTAEGCAHQPGKPCRFKDFRDGSSNSILLLAVTDETAPVWTQPVTSNVDLNQPRTGLWRSADGNFLAGRCDGSVALLSESNPDDTIRALLTINGGETITDVK